MQHTTHITKSQDKSFSYEQEGVYVVMLDNVSGTFAFNIKASGVKLSIFGLYTGTSNQLFQVHTIQHHHAPSATSNLLIKSVLYGKSQFNYQGLIRIEQHCNGSHAYQKNQNLLMSSESKVTSEPNLEILSHEVFCTHGSTTGKPDSNQLHYLHSRGLSYTDAEKLYVEGFLQEVKDGIQTVLQK